MTSGTPSVATQARPGATPAADTSWRRIALWTVLFQFAWYWRQLPALFSQGALPDTDDFTRLMEVRNWMAGQGWYDLVQHRMNPPFGADIHWSRLVDVPIAALIGFFGLFTDSATAERLTALVWPTLLLVATVLVIVRICRALADDFNPLLAVMFTVMCFTALTEFMPGRLDHHSVQILMFCLTLLGIANAATWWGHLLAGATMAASISVGLDAVLLIVLMLAWFGVEWALGRDPKGRGLLRVAAGLAGAALILFPANIAPSQWLVAHCDANSIVYVAALVLIGASFGLLALASNRLTGATPLATFALRLGAGAVLAAGVAGLLYALFPECAGGPYGAIDPQLHDRWLVNVNEAMGLFTKLAKTPQLWFSGLGYSALLTIAGGIVAWRRGRLRPAIIAVYATFFLSVATMFVQYRAMRIGIFASIPLCVIFAGMAWQWLSERLAGRRMLAGALQALVVASMMSPVWLLVGDAVLPGKGSASAKDAASAVAAWKRKDIYPFCNRQSQYDVLASLPKGYVMSDIDSGSPILVFTDHSVVGGPYHRNARAILDMLDFFETDLAKPRRIAARRGIDYVAWCDPGNLSGPEYAGNPALAARLARGETPDWLERLSPKGDRLQVFRVLR